MADESDRADRADEENQDVVDEKLSDEAEGGGEEQLRAVEQTEERLDEEDDEDTPSDVGPDRSQRD